MNPIDLDYLEKVKIPEYEGYGWANACKEMRLLIAEIRRLQSERSDDAELTKGMKQVGS
jgi:hypothetical protein